MEKVEGTELIIRTEIEETPFTIVNITEDKTFFGAIGMYKITNDYETAEEVKKELSEINWNRIIQVVGILIEQMLDHKYKEP